MQSVESYGIFSYGKPKIITFDNKTTLRIGKFCSIAGEVKIFLDAEHRQDWVTTYPFFPKLRKRWPEVEDIEGCPGSKGNVVIEHDVWVGWKATLMSGVTVRSGAVVGAEAVVAKDVPEYAIVVGNPARVVKYRFDEKTIQALLRIKWWDWPTNKIRENVKLLSSSNIGEFVRKFS
jgi:acetyltransferase-like isoleucine patch superfamily enzyme